MKKCVKIVAALLLLSIVATASACRYTSNTLIVTEPAGTVPQPSYSNPAESTSYNAPESTQPIPQESTTLPPVSEAPTSAVPSTLPPESTTLPPVTEAPTTEAPTTEANPASWSKQQVLQFLSDAVNKTKGYTGPLTVDRSEDLGITIEELSPNLPALKGIANSLISKFIKPVNEVVQFNGGKGTSDGEEIPLLLPKRQAFTLTIDGVSKATASRSGENVIVDITLVEETSNKDTPPKYNAMALGYLDVNSVDLSMITIEALDFVYLGSTIHAVVRPDGYVESAEYHIPLKVSAAGRAVGVRASFAGTGYQTEKWNIHW